MLASAIRTAAVSHRVSAIPIGRREMTTALAALERIGLVLSLERDATVFFEGSDAKSYFKVTRGIIRTCKLLLDGRRLISDFYLPGDFFGLTGEGENLWSAEAVTAVTLMRWTRKHVDGLAEQHLGVAKCLRSMVSDDIVSAQEHMLLLGRKDATEKVASFLLMMADRGGDSQRVSLPMTRLDMADYLGLTVETVSRTVTQLRSRRLIRVQDSHDVIFVNRGAIEDLANAA
jgi:CRP/FNR family transcriptional regulator, anaerobic regulatory protein